MVVHISWILVDIMLIEDTFLHALTAINSQRLRTVLIVLAMSIGVTSVTVLIALSESARRYIVNEFKALGTHLVIVLPGRTETTGGAPPVFGETPRDLTLEDAESLLHSRDCAVDNRCSTSYGGGAGARNQCVRLNSRAIACAAFGDGARYFFAENRYR